MLIYRLFFTNAILTFNCILLRPGPYRNMYINKATVEYMKKAAAMQGKN